MHPLPALLILMMSMTVLLLCNGFLAESKLAMVVLAFLTGANALAIGPPIQLLLMEHSREAEMLGSSLGQSGFNIGNALGAFLGGVPLTLGYAYTAPQWVAAALALCGVGLSAIMLARPKGISSAKSSVNTRRKTMATTIPNTENAFAIQYSPSAGWQRCHPRS